MGAPVAWLLSWLLAPGQPSRVELDWQAPDACPSADTVHAEIDSLLRDAGTDDTGSARAKGRVVVDDTGQWRVSIALELDDLRTERTIEGASCEELSSAAAFIIATAIDPRVATLPPPDAAEQPAVPSPPDEPEPEPKPEPEPEPQPNPSSRSDATGSRDDTKPAASPQPPDVARSPASSQTRVRLAPGIRGGLGFGPNPRVGGVVGLSFAVFSRGWRAEALGTYWTPSSRLSSANVDVGVRVQSWDVAARGCWVPAVSRVEFPLCAGLGLGAKHGAGTGDLANSRKTATPWIRLLAGPGVLVRLGQRFAAGLDVSGYVTLADSAFRTNPSGVVHDRRAGGFSAAARVELRLR